MIGFGSEIRDYSFASRREFIMVSGDSYCSSSLAGNTRKYHGLLVSGRRVYLSTLDEFINGKRISVARYSGGFDSGLEYVTGFSLYPPEFHYFVDGVFVKKTIVFDGSVRIKYDVLGKAEIQVVPLITDRNIHETRKTFDFSQKRLEDGIAVGRLRITSPEMNFHESPDIYWNVFYSKDYERGYDCIEHLYTPGYFSCTVKNGSVEVKAEIEGAEKIAKAVSHKRPSTSVECLELSADSFLVGSTIYAGYHWFAEPWGRDAFISLPGLLLEREKFREAKNVFRFFAKRMKNGVIPNVLGKYNSSDASLWFIYALTKYFEKREDKEFLSKMKPYVEEIMTKYPESDIAELDGYLISVKPCSTWMDTRYTPREGKPVEINALWIYSLKFAQSIGIEVPFSPKKAEKEFNRFWNPEKSCFYDVIDPYDDSIRPNQVIAVALGVGDGERAKALNVIRTRLLTPYGLRTLSPDDDRYRGRYCGDKSYHNGCVWPWLMGFYVEALLRQGESGDRLKMLLIPLLEHIRDAGLGTISEIFDGDPPHEPNGCISQAWSVAEVLRACKLLSGFEFT